MFLMNFNLMGLVYTFLFGGFFVLSYFVIIATRLENLFKQGQTWQIKAAQVILAVICAYFMANAANALINSSQF